MGSMNELIWAYGPMTDGDAKAHGTTNNDRGGLNNFFVIQLPLASFYMKISSSLIAMAAVIYMF